MTGEYCRDCLRGDHYLCTTQAWRGVDATFCACWAQGHWEQDADPDDDYTPHPGRRTPPEQEQAAQNRYERLMGWD